MKFDTELFGVIDYDVEDIINFTEGLPGFENEKEFLIILDEDGEHPFKYLQSLNNRDLTLVIVDPFSIYTDYEVEIPDSALDKLGILYESDIIIYTIVTISDELENMTTNLAGPIVINALTGEAKQIVLDDERYNTKHYIFHQE